MVPSEETNLPKTEDTRADELRMGLAGLLRKAHIEGDAEFLKEGVRALSRALMEMEVEEHIGASRNERTPRRKGLSATATAREPGIRGWGCGALGAQGERWQLLSLAPRERVPSDPYQKERHLL